MDANNNVIDLTTSATTTTTPQVAVVRMGPPPMRRAMTIADVIVDNDFEDEPVYLGNMPSGSVVTTAAQAVDGKKEAISFMCTHWCNVNMFESHGAYMRYFVTQLQKVLADAKTAEKIKYINFCLEEAAFDKVKSYPDPASLDAVWCNANRPHIQFYVHLRKKMRGTTLKKLLNIEFNFEASRGNAGQNIAYVSKAYTFHGLKNCENPWSVENAKSRFWVWGERPEDTEGGVQHGAKSGVKGGAIGGKMEKDRWDEFRKVGYEDDGKVAPWQNPRLNSQLVVSHLGNLSRGVAEAKLMREIDPLPQLDLNGEPNRILHFVYGVPSAGKSTWIHSEAHAQKMKTFNKCQGTKGWFDGIDNDVDWIIMDEASPYTMTEYVLQLCKIWGDPWPFSVEIKGAVKKIRPKAIWFTSNFTPVEIFSVLNKNRNDLKAVLRRFRFYECNEEWTLEKGFQFKDVPYMEVFDACREKIPGISVSFQPDFNSKDFKRFKDGENV